MRCSKMPCSSALLNNDPRGTKYRSSKSSYDTLWDEYFIYICTETNVRKR